LAPVQRTHGFPGPPVIRELQESQLH
jgi:hypothetical protein